MTQNLKQFFPVILTLLIFILAQGLSTVLVFILGTEATTVSLVLMVSDILAVLCCYFFLHNIRFVTVNDFFSISWWPGLLAVAGGLLGAMSISILNENVELPEAMLQMYLGMSQNLLGLLTLVIIGPVAEELIFREAIEGEMLRRGVNPWLAILVSALAFSAIHINLAQVLFALPLGIIFGIIYYKTGNIILTSILHILNNGLVVTQIHAFGEDFSDISYAEWFGSTSKAYAFMVLFAALCLGLMMVFWKHYRPREETIKSNTT